MDGIDELIFKLDDIENKVKDTKKITRKIAARMAAKIRMNFKNETEPDGKKWEKSKRAIKDNGQSLSDTGRLKASITYKYDALTAKAGTNVKYARVMHFGAKKGAFGSGTVDQNVRSFTRKRRGKKEKVKAHKRRRKINFPFGNIPSRKFAGITKEDKDEYLKMIKEFLKGD